MQLGVHSEIGKLRKVMVSRPSLAHERLTPGNCHDLLFDDVIWVQKARSDHADFVLKMKDRGIEVFDIQDLLTDILRDSPRPGPSCSTGASPPIRSGRRWPACCALGLTTSTLICWRGTCSVASCSKTCPARS
jgi:hypothetical protein